MGFLMAWLTYMVLVGISAYLAHRGIEAIREIGRSSSYDLAGAIGCLILTWMIAVGLGFVACLSLMGHSGE